MLPWRTAVAEAGWICVGWELQTLTNKASPVHCNHGIVQLREQELQVYDMLRHDGHELLQILHAQLKVTSLSRLEYE